MQNNNKKGKFIVLSGPSGVGKGTICKELLTKLNAWYSISMTTREKREGEIEGKDYYFVTKEDFEQNIRNNQFIEYAIYNDNYYGTPKSKIEEKLNQGIDVISEIEVKGAENIKKIYPDSLLIYILPPSMEELRNRLEKRGTNTKEDIDNRLKIAYKELEKIDIYDYKIINNDVEESVKEIEKIIIKNK